ncbi:MAG: response regulator [Dokdonella sp.]
MYRILLVDDEPNILTALRRCLARIDVSLLDGEALRVETFTSPEAAIERCEEQDFDLVMSDYRMPSMSGVEFLTRLMVIQPMAPRIIISGYADREAIISAVNEAHLTRFIEKPWDEEVLHRAVATILGGSGQRAVRPAAGHIRANPDRHLQRLEEDCPGITHIDFAENGGITIDEDDGAD